jgi:hypothetical protein
LKKLILLLALLFHTSPSFAANNAAQNLKAKAVAARTAQNAANQTKYAALITRMTTLLVAAADKGEERYVLPSSDQDFKDWTSQAGMEYLTSPGRMLKAQVVNYITGPVLEISWENPVADPVP